MLGQLIERPYAEEWSLTDLANVMSTSEESVKKKISYWLNRGILKERKRGDSPVYEVIKVARTPLLRSDVIEIRYSELHSNSLLMSVIQLRDTEGLKMLPRLQHHQTRNGKKK